MKHASNAPEVVCAMVGTAGHVDHGKTELVKMLTGCDTDWLREEKERGMSIDLGFAPYHLADGRVVGIVDVPGHKDFIRNMVAGAASIDVLMLVIAADDGVMPQTDEHVRILKLMRAPSVMVALTKIDLVDESLRAMVEQDVAAFLGRMGLSGAPVVPVSSRTLEGIDRVRETLEQLVTQAGEHARTGELERSFRMNIERAFHVKGYGTVVTGVPISGTVGVDHKLTLHPSGRPTSVRALQTYGQEAREARAGACVALNLRDVLVSSVSRGMTVAAPGRFVAVESFMATLENGSQTGVVRHRQRVKLHVGTSVGSASLALLETPSLPPGEETFVQVTLAEPLVVDTGDRFIVRQLSPALTLGGGTVLSVGARAIRRRSPALLTCLHLARQRARAGDLLGAALLAHASPLIEEAALLRLTSSPAPRDDQLRRAQVEAGLLADLGGGAWLIRPWLPLLFEKIKRMLAQHHQQNRCDFGMEPAQLCQGVDLSPKNARRLVELLVEDGGDIVLVHGCLALRDHRPALSDRQWALKEAIAQRVLEAGMSPPARGNLMSELEANEAEMSLVLRLLGSEGVVTILGSYLMSSAALQDCREKLRALFRQRPQVDVNAFRERTGASRRLAVAILEALDQEGMTRRTGEGRVLVSRSS